MVEREGYGLRLRVPVVFADAVARITEALKAEGFGVLTTIDVQQTLREKLGRQFRKYTILGACNPPLASRAFDADLDVGLLLPCNVIVYEVAPGESMVAALAPTAALGIAGDNPALAQVAAEAEHGLRAALERVKQDLAASARKAGP